MVRFEDFKVGVLDWLLDIQAMGTHLKAIYTLYLTTGQRASCQALRATNKSICQPSLAYMSDHHPEAKSRGASFSAQG